MKKILASLLVFLVFSGCSQDYNNININEEFSGVISVDFKQMNYSLSFRRSLPGIYSFEVLEGDFRGAVIDIKSEVYDVVFEDLSILEQKLMKSSFFSLFINAFDYVTQNPDQLKTLSINKDVIVFDVDNGNEEFLFTYDLTKEQPLSIKFVNDELNVIFVY